MAMVERGAGSISQYTASQLRSKSVSTQPLKPAAEAAGTEAGCLRHQLSSLVRKRCETDISAVLQGQVVACVAAFESQCSTSYLSV